MEQILFERPREKLSAKGAAYLSTTELLQVVIGSGTAKVSGARLAKRVAGLIGVRPITLEALTAIQGIGFAKACQIAAALELGSRLAGVNNHEATDQFAQTVTKAVAAIKQKTLLAYMYDGAGREVLHVNYLIAQPKIAVRKICADALLNNARKLQVVIGSKDVALTLETSDLGLLKQLKKSLEMLNIELKNIYIANSKGAEKWKI